MDVPYVNEQSAALAREFERRFQLLSPEGGILFVAVEPQPEKYGKVKTYVIRLGISRKLDTGTGVAVAKKLMEKEIDAREFNIQVAVYRGVSGAGRDQDHASTRPTPS